MSGVNERRKRKRSMWAALTKSRIAACEAEGWTVQDENQPMPEGMFRIGGFGDSEGGYSVYCAEERKSEVLARLREVMNEAPEGYR